MEIVFDPIKDANIAKHGLSLADAAAFEMADAVVEADTRHPYAEARCLVFTVRDDVVRAISYRRAHEKEMRRHGR